MGRSLCRSKHLIIKENVLKSFEEETLCSRCLCWGPPNHKIKVSVITELAWQNLASANMFIATNIKPLYRSDFSVIVSSTFASDPHIEVQGQKLLCDRLQTKTDSDWYNPIWR